MVVGYTAQTLVKGGMISADNYDRYFKWQTLGSRIKKRLGLKLQSIFFNIATVGWMKKNWWYKAENKKPIKK